jgi:electron transport complex protein RnfC
MGILDKFFKGPSWGVHPDDHKRPAADAPLRKLPPPAKVYMPLQQHVGGAARPIVLVGQKVLKGQLLAEPSGNISAPIHAPVSGTVSAIGEITAPHASGLGFTAITIANDYEDRWIDAEQVADPFALTPEEITKKTAAAGIVGLGGATFPDAAKFALGRRLKVDT